MAAHVLNLNPPEPFNVKGEPTTVYQRWKRWKRSFQYYICATNVTDEGHKKGLFIHAIGTEAQDIWEQFDPASTGTTLDEAIAKFEEHFKVVKNTPYERHILHKIEQKHGESIEQFLTRLRKISVNCEYAAEEGCLCLDSKNGGEITFI